MKYSLPDSKLKHTFIHYYSQTVKEIEEYKYEKALRKLMYLENVIQGIKLDTNFVYQTFDTEIEYYAAQMQEMLENGHKNINERKDIVWMDLPIADVYKYMAHCLVELKEYTKAVQSLEKLLKWNSLSSFAYYELSFLNQWVFKNHQHALALSIEGLKNSYMDRDRAKGYRHTGAALIDLDKLIPAQAAYIKSLHLEPANSIALEQLEYIESKDKNLVPRMSIEESDKILQSVNIPISIEDIFTDAIEVIEMEMKKKTES